MLRGNAPRRRGRAHRMKYQYREFRACGADPAGSIGSGSGKLRIVERKDDLVCESHSKKGLKIGLFWSKIV